MVGIGFTTGADEKLLKRFSKIQDRIVNLLQKYCNSNTRDNKWKVEQIHWNETNNDESHIYTERY